MQFEASTHGNSVSRILLGSVTAALLLQGCASSPQPNPVAELISKHGLTAGDASSPPYFLGIDPGTTTEQELLGILREQGIANQCKDGGSGMSCADLLFISLDLASHTVDGVGYQPFSPMTLEEVIEKYGDPTVVQVVQDGIPEVVRSVALLFFDEIRTRLTLPSTEGGAYSITPSARIENVVHLSGAVYQNMTDAYVVPWNEYGDYPQTVH